VSDYQLFHGDCLEVMAGMEAQSVDSIVCDPPYGTTACKWDSVIPFEPMWDAIKHVLKPKGAVVLFGSQPFTSALVMSNVEWFKYCWVWDKVNMFTNQMASAFRPMTQHEDIVVFASGKTVYNPQKRRGKPYSAKRKGKIDVYSISPRNGINVDGLMSPGTVISLKGRLPNEQGIHPTQKPVALLEYLIRTYTNEGDTVLDFTMGSGTTGVAAMHTGRKFIGVEMEADYFRIAQQRIAKAAQMADGQFVTKAGRADDLDGLPMFGGEQ
jgi:site-specific DNA-methyltransferase (adenine-specific)